MEASTLTHATRRGLFARRSPVLKLEKDERLIALIRSGHGGAFEVLFDRYQSRLLAFCSSMLKSRQDAEDVLQEVFVNAHAAILADQRKINARPWLYRIARNRCLNHLRRPVPEGQDSMDIHPHQNGTTTAEHVQNREELRQLLDDVGTLPETQRTALLLREIDQLCYEDIAVAMETTVPAVKSLLVRARITLAESSEARTLSCEEVRVALAEAAEGLRKATGPERIHVRACEGCAGFRSQLRADHKALAAILPIGPLAFLKIGLLGKIFGGGGAGAGGAASGGAAATTSVGAIGGGAAAGTSATAGGLGAIGGVIGTKAAAGVATAAILTAGAVEVTKVVPNHQSGASVAALTAPPVAHKRPDKEKVFAKRLLAAAAGTGVAVATPEAAGGAEPSEAPAEEPVPPETAVEPEPSTATITPELPVAGQFEEQPAPGSDGAGRPAAPPETTPTTPAEPSTPAQPPLPPVGNPPPPDGTLPTTPPATPPSSPGPLDGAPAETTAQGPGPPAA